MGKTTHGASCLFRKRLSPRRFFGQSSVRAEVFDFLESDILLAASDWRSLQRDEREMKMDVLLRGETSEWRLLCRRTDGEQMATANGQQMDGERSLYERGERTAITYVNMANER